MDDRYAALHAHYRWQVPARFNIAAVCCARWAAGPDASKRIAVRAVQERAAARNHTYRDLQAAADAWSHALAAAGVARGDRVAVVLPQRFETAAVYMAVFQMGAVAVPLSTLFGPEAQAFRLRHSGAVAAVAAGAVCDALRALGDACPALAAVLDADAPVSPRGAYPAVDTAADDPAILLYTSGTTGDPKGALLPHRVLIGNLPGFVASHNGFGFAPGGGASDAVFWSPADWAWTGGLMDALLPTLYFGRPIVASAERFDPARAFELMQAHGVTHTFLFPTALKAMMKAVPDPRGAYPRLALQCVMSAGEAVGDAVMAYGRDRLGLTINEMFGQTEMNYVVGNSTRPGFGWPARPGSMGRPYPGHRVGVIDEAGAECADGVVGEVAVHRTDVHGEPDPIFFLGYWNAPEATAAKFTGPGCTGWCRTGDLALRDADGYLWYQGRADDVFKAAGYRIGPGEVENCLVKHPAVANAAVVPKPDAARGALVKAYVVLAPDFIAARASCGRPAADFDQELVEALQAHVKGRLAPYEYPKEIEFVDALPMTTTGKVQRRVLRLQEEERARAR